MWKWVCECGNFSPIFSSFEAPRFVFYCMQIHQVQGQKENMNSCLKKTELLYKSARETHNLYSTPHILTSSLLKFPFSAAYLFLKEMGESSTALIDTSLLLLDLHLPKEAIQILELECDMFSTAFDNKWAQAKANELLMDYKLGEVWLRENLSITKDEPMSWLLMGHNRYISGQFAEALEAYEQVKTFLPVLVKPFLQVPFPASLHS
jgi:hypothetical protein